MQSLILAGGFGTRLSGPNAECPKPLVSIGGMPILWHLIRLLESQGIDEFILALGFGGQAVKAHFVEVEGFTRPQGNHEDAAHLTIQGRLSKEVTIHLVETGLHSMTGGRMLRVSDFLAKGEPFLMTYVDGLADIDVRALLDFHRSHGRLATVTAVRPPERFGRLELDGEQVACFSEKKERADEWINGGFFVLQPEVLERIHDETTCWEHEPLEALARTGQLMAYRHTGFWACMDTPKEKMQLEEIWNSGCCPWKVW